MNEHGEIKKHSVRKAFILFAIGAVVLGYLIYTVVVLSNPAAFEGKTTAVTLFPLVAVTVLGWLWWPRNR